MYAFLIRIEPVENMNRWYEVAVQPTLLDDLAVVCRWGSRETTMQRMRIIPVADADEGREIAAGIVAHKLRRGYTAVEDTLTVFRP